MQDIVLPDVGENIESGSVVGIHVKVGDQVNKDQTLLELETDKASLDVPSPFSGVIKEILINEGDDVAIGSVIMKVDESASASSAPKAKKEKKTAAPKAQPTKKAATQAAPKVETPAPVSSTPQKKSNESIPPQTDVAAAPSVRRLARELGIEISRVPGTQAGGRVSKDDVKNFAKGIIKGTSSAPAGTSAGIPSKPLPDFTKFGEIERSKMTKIRQVTKDHMSLCWNTIPHVTQFDKADITELDQLRKKYSTKERKLTVTPFLLKVMAAVLKAFPKFNASIDPETNEVIYKKYVNIGVAVDTENGLLVPVLKNVDQKNIMQITDELTETAARARNKKVTLEDLQGGSMTLTNLGGVGGHAFTPIVNWPEVCILGVSRGGYEPVWNGKEFEPRLKLPLCLSYDHRLIDGAEAARFLRWICEAIEQPFMMHLEQ